MEKSSNTETTRDAGNLKGKLLFFGKIFFVGILLLVLLIPVQLIRSLVFERQQRQREATQEIAATWGNSQTIAGPVLMVPFRSIVRDEKGKVISTLIRHAYFLPENLRVKTVADPQIRYRGIFKVPLYNAKSRLEGNFKAPDFSGWNIPADNILWEESKLWVGISDIRAIREKMELSWQGEKTVFQPSSSSSFLGNMVEVPVKGLKDSEKTSDYAFMFDINLNGSESLSFVPVGSQTEVALNSSWANPSFSGAYLPTERDIRPGGFQAQWKTLLLGRSFPQKWLDKFDRIPSSDRDSQFAEVSVTESVSNDMFKSSALGVDFKLPIDAYLMTDRAIKYAVLFIFLTFLTYFLFEVFNPQVKTHPIQYLLVGFALCIFYLLLLSLSEYIAFALAYLTASSATVLLITSYSARILKNLKRSLTLGGLLAALYVYLYSLLQSQDYSLLMGSLGLFFILALVMFLTRKVDWYALSRR